MDKKELTINEIVKELTEKYLGYTAAKEVLPYYAVYAHAFLHGMSFQAKEEFFALTKEEEKSIIERVCMEKGEAFYFSFGSNEGYPFKNGYIIVYAFDLPSACRTFKELYPNKRDPECLNCSFVYSKEEWDRLDCFKDAEPLKTIFAMQC